MNRDIVIETAKRHACFYVYDGDGIRNTARELSNALPDVDMLYSVKCNPHPQILATLAAEGYGADAASSGEVMRAAEAGMAAKDIYYSAPGKTLSDIRSTIGKATIVCDSLGEIERVCEAARMLNSPLGIGIRLNPDFSFDGGCGAPSKFGIDESAAWQLMSSFHADHVTIDGIHIHLRSQCLDMKAITRYFGLVLSLADRFCSHFGELSFVNMGSCIGIPGASDRPIDLKKLSGDVNVLLQNFRLRHPSTRLLVETGRYVTGPHGIFVTKVLDRKESHGKTFLIVAGMLNGFLRPAIARWMGASGIRQGAEPLFTSQDAYTIRALGEGEPTERVTIAGNLCTSSDIVATDIPLPHLNVGDLLVINNAGAYAAALSPMQFSSGEKPIELFE